MSVLHDTPKREDLIFDIGLHKGEDTEFYLKKGFRVVAIEADPDLAQLCRDRFKAFIDQGRLTIVEGAIVQPDALESGQTTVRFFRNEEVSVWGTVCADWKERNEKLGASSSSIDVETLDFVSVLQEHGIPHYMKIDVEGVDLVCVEALKSFRERPDYISIESDKGSLDGISDEVGSLADLGYDAFKAVEQSKIPECQTPPNPAREGQYVAHQFESGASGLFGSELGDDWKSRQRLLRQYRTIRVGYYFLGDEGVANQWTFPGASLLRSAIRRSLRLFTKAAVPGWYDTHARHRSAGAAHG